MGQRILLSSSESKNELYLDPNRFYSYNLYEKSRWGVGLGYDIKLGRPSRPGLTLLSLGVYGAWGYEDQRLKWGGNVGLKGLSKSGKKYHTYVDVFHDLTPPGTRNMGTFELLQFTETGNFMTRRFNDTWRVTAGVSRMKTAKLQETLELRWSRERELWSGNSLIYPASGAELRSMPHADFAELRLYVAHTSGLSGELLAGTMTPWKKYFARLLLQYGHRFFFDPLTLDLFAQSGIVNDDAPYSRCFDLGGTWGSPLALERSLLTARPNEFTANVFGLVTLKLSLKNPLVDYYHNVLLVGTSPRPFVMCNAAWGTVDKSSSLQVPDKGILEVGGGVDGLLVWGSVQWGAAVAYRLTPTSAAYHLPATEDNFVFLLTAKLGI
jgi:hypothetical protein